MTLSASIGQSGPTGSGAESESTLPAVGTTWTFSGTPLAPVQVTIAGKTPQPITSSSLSLTLTRGSSGTIPSSVAGSFSLTTTSGVVTGSVSGEALLSGGVWHLRGMAALTGGAGASAGSGGFTADITLGNPGTGDDTVSWNVDGVVS